MSPPPSTDPLLAGLRVRGPSTALTAVSLLVGEALSLLPLREGEARRRLQLALDVCASQRPAPYLSRRGRKTRGLEPPGA